jgi:hypothetical protein
MQRGWKAADIFYLLNFIRPHKLRYRPTVGPSEELGSPV